MRSRRVQPVATRSHVGEETLASIRDRLWQLELDIYAARGNGDLHVYASHVSGHLLVWPPWRTTPMRAEDLRRQAEGFGGTDQEVLTLSLIEFSMDGDTAILFYGTHRARLPDGRPCDEHFQVVHVWLRRDDRWLLLGGMARPSPAPQASPAPQP